MSGEALTIELVREAGDWPETVGEAPGAIARAVAGRVPGAIGDVTVMLSDDDGVRALNARFRGFDKPTNVLSFPSGEAAAGAHLGDVALACQTVLREAAGEGKPFDHHFAHLVVHGILHLVGYDHVDDREAALMERLETEILADLAIPNPYTEDTPAAAGA